MKGGRPSVNWGRKENRGRSQCVGGSCSRVVPRGVAGLGWRVGEVKLIIGKKGGRGIVLAVDVYGGGSKNKRGGEKKRKR